MSCLLHQSPKFDNNVLIFVGLTTLVAFVKFDWLIHTKRVILCIIIRNVHQISSHCLITLDPCILTQSYTQIRNVL